MTSTSVTSTDLLDGLRDPRNDTVWHAFFERYSPLLVSFCRRLGLSDANARDAAQETLVAFLTSYQQGAYQREKGRLRTWLFTIARNKTRDLQRRRAREMIPQDASCETAFLDRVPDEDQLEQLWEDEWRRAVLAACMDEVRQQVEPHTMRAFELLVLEGRSADEVAAELNMSRDTVYQAKSRILARIQKFRTRLEQTW
jgi:RNA polymerase sigma-70 factor (ECF subfamily)